MDKIWLRSYPQGVPESINLDRFTSLSDLFYSSCAEFKERPAFSNFGTEITYQELEIKVNAFAAYLHNNCKLAKGDRIAIMLPNLIQYPIAMFAALACGLIVVNVNPLYTTRELEHQLIDSGAKAILLLENVAYLLEEVLPNTNIEYIITTKLGDCLDFAKGNVINFVMKYIKRKCPGYNLPTAVSFKNTLKYGLNHSFNKVEVTKEDIAFLQYTGGTTGIAKGAILRHKNILANMEQADAWVEKVVTKGKEIVITALPLYHIFSLTANCMLFLHAGGLNVLITNPRDIRSFVKELAKHKFTIFTGVNTLFNALLNNKDFHKLDFSHLKIVLGGGMAVQRIVAEKWQQVTGCVLAEAYGLTETSPAVCVNPINITGYNGTIGLPLPSTDILILDENDTPCSINQAGELCVKGPQVMSGYWQKEEESKQAFTKDGWLRTGDIAVIDENGFVKIVDRKKDMIIVSGFNVFPNEVEEVIAEHPGVLEVAAIGIPDKKAGEIVKVFVVKKDPRLTKEQIIEHAHRELTAYKVPKLVEFKDELPKSNVGKILRRELRDL